MAQIDILTAQVASLIQAFNNLNANARKTSEFPLQDPLVDTSLIRVEESGVSKHITVNQIIEKTTSFLNNELLYFSGTTILANAITLAIGSVWRINSIVYSNTTDKAFTVPYTSSIGLVRIDLLVGDNENNVTRIQGDESDIAITPLHPNDKVIICAIEVTDSSLMPVSAKGNKSKRFAGNGQSYTLPSGAIAFKGWINESVQYLEDPAFVSDLLTFTQAGDVVTFKKAITLNQRIVIDYTF